MGFPELFILAVGLSMDAFAVSVCKLLGASFADRIAAIDHWIAFVLLSLIGGGMIKEALGKEEESCDPSLAPLTMLMLAVATSIDALAVGITFAFLRVDILPAVALIGVCTFVISAVGVKVGNVFGARYRSKAELFGGAVLVLTGLKILLEHLELLPF